mgnify:CR=1 FL=1
MKYSLEQILEVKKNRCEDSVKMLNKKKEILQKEEEQLKALEKEI